MAHIGSCKASLLNPFIADYLGHGVGLVAVFEDIVVHVPRAFVDPLAKRFFTLCLLKRNFPPPQ